MSKALGRGLTALFGEETMRQAQEKIENEEFLYIETLKIEPNLYQPRKTFDDEKLRELSDSIKKHGILTPIAITIARENGMHMIIAGERRWRASRMAGLEKIPAVIIDATGQKVMELALIENLQRQDLNPIEEAKGFSILMNDFGLTQDAVSEIVSKSRSAVANSLRLLTLDEKILQDIAQGKVSSGHGRAILTLSDPRKRQQLVENIKKNKMSVRDAENAAKGMTKFKPNFLEDETIIYIKKMEEKLEQKMGRRIKINNSKNRGTIMIDYYSSDDLEQLSDAIMEMDI